MTNQHEQTDIEPAHALAFAAVLAAFLVIAYGAALTAFHYFNSPSLVASQPRVETVLQHLPEPRLQTSPQQDLERLRNANHNVLTTYGWVNRENKIVRIPIERAMDIIAQQGLPDFQQRSSP